MEKFKVSFEANNQQLKSIGTKHASDTYADIEATFILGEKWTDMDSVSAVWWNDFTRVATVLDSQGKCVVPHEVLARKGCVRVNLVGSIVEGDELITRLTSYSAEAVQVNEKIKLTGSETSELTPSQYEQFVANVKADADRAEAGATASEQSAQSASESATASANSATSSAQSASDSAESAQNASESAQSAENAKDDAEDARDEILGMRATAETLEAGSDATASYSDGLLTLGIPRGDQGIQGIQGETGATPNLTIGTVETLAPTEDATATITGTAENPVLNLGLPKGDMGDVSQEQLDAAVSDLKSDFEQSIEYPENTAFASRIQNDTQYVSFDDCKLGLKKYTSLVPYNNTKFISSSGSDSYAFRNPYYGFTFGLDNVNTEAYRLKGGMPQGLVNETLLIEETLTKNQETAFDFYTVNQPKGTVILFKIPKTTETGLFTPSVNHFTEDCLELNDVQDTFARYSIRGSKSDITPSVTKLTGKLVATTNGTLSDNASYDTYYFKCPVSRMSVTCTNAFRCVITTKDPTLITINGFLSSVVYSYESGRVDTFDVELGKYVVFSLSHAQQPNIDLKTDYVKSFSLPTLRLAYGQKNGFYKIEKIGSATYVYIYYASGDKVVGWELHNAPTAGINSDTWQLGHVMGYDFDGRIVSNGVELVAGGEFELAFKEYGASDYCGGNNHGDENQVDFTLIIDGEKIDLSNVDSDYHAFDRIDAIEHALINRCDTPDEDILKHQKIWTFENGTVKIRQTLEFLEALQCDFLCCMFAANRSYFTHGVRQGRVGTEVMTSSSFPDVQTDGNEMAYVMYGTNASAKITARTCEHSPTASLWINPAVTINKLYYNFFHRIPNTSVAQGTVLWWESEYDVAYN